MEYRITWEGISEYRITWEGISEYRITWEGIDPYMYKKTRKRRNEFVIDKFYKCSRHFFFKNGTVENYKSGNQWKNV